MEAKYNNYSDLEKAFDKAPHKRLISKLYCYGINEYVINWIKDFLTERKFRVKVEDIGSLYLSLTPKFKT